MSLQLRALSQPRQLISLVPMIDVMLILLIFFMVTSTYLNLDMIPIVDRTEEAPASTSSMPNGSTLLVRIGADERTYFRGQPISAVALAEVISPLVAENPLISIVLLPSSRATTQALITAMDTLTSAGVTRLRLMQLEVAQ